MHLHEGYIVHNSCGPFDFLGRYIELLDLLALHNDTTPIDRPMDLYMCDQNHLEW